MDTAATVQLRRRLPQFWLHRRWVYPVAGLLGLVTALVNLGWEFLGGDVGVVRQVAGDNAAGLAAFRVYIGEGWHWPLLRSTGLGPDGVNVAFTDSIPLLAVTAKVVRPLGVAAETWWAIWYWLIYLLQAITAVFAARAWGARSAAIQLGAAGLALLTPVLLYQSVHPSLSAHFVLLAAWGMAGRVARRDPAAASDRHWFSALAVVALAIHPYLAVMTLAMLAGSAIDQVARSRLTTTGAGAWIGRSLALAGVWLVLGGYLSTVGASDGGYGIYSTYLSGPFRPVISDLLPSDPLGADLNPSHPGYSYLGAGVLVVALAGLVANRRRLQALLVANQGLALCLALLVAWAISPVVHIWSDDPIDVPARLTLELGSARAAGLAASGAGLTASAAMLGLWWRIRRQTRFAPTLGVGSVAIGALSAAGLATPAVIEAMTVQFRASGRFAWPALYGVAVLGLVGLEAGVRQRRSSTSRELRAAATIAGVAIVVGLQYLDTATLREATRHILLPGGEARQTHVSYLTDLVAAHERVRLAPDFRCTYFPEGVMDFVDITHAASAAGRPINRIYSARQPEPDGCPVAQSPDLSDPATVWFLIEPVTLLDDPVRRAEVRNQCRLRGTINACTHHWDDLPAEISSYFSNTDD